MTRKTWHLFERQVIELFRYQRRMTPKVDRRQLCRRSIGDNSVVSLQANSSLTSECCV